MKTALFIVDPQLDFMPKGSLEVAFGDKIVPVINSFIDKFDIVIASRDWHPEYHQSFTTQHDGTKLLDVVQVEGKDMVIWPPHCVQNTEGAKFHPNLNFKGELFTKGDNPNEHPFSGYMGVNPDGKTVEQYLKDNGVEQVYVVGLAGDYCVKESALDCSKKFKTYLIIDATKFIGTPDETIKILIENGISIINSKDLTFTLSKEKSYKKEKSKKKDEEFSPKQAVKASYSTYSTITSTADSDLWIAVTRTNS
jgi:nicotinamidase/pyrazinamidase